MATFRSAASTAGSSRSTTRSQPRSREAQADGVNLDWSALKTAAIDTTAQSLKEMTAVRDAYGSKLDEAELDMAADGYDMDAVAGAEGEGDPSAQQQATAPPRSTTKPSARPTRRWSTAAAR